MRYTKLLLTLVFVGIMVLPISALPVARGAGTIRYVKTDADGANDGSSWANAYPSLQIALTSAASSDEVWVAAGVYTLAPSARIPLPLTTAWPSTVASPAPRRTVTSSPIISRVMLRPSIFSYARNS